MLKILFKTFIAFLFLAPNFGAMAEPSTRDFAFLEGNWEFSDSSVSGSYKETGTRTCGFILGGDYLKCENVGTDNRGNTRTYIFFFNYNSFDQQYEMISLTEGYSRKGQFILTRDEGSNVWHLTNPPGQEPRKGTNHWAMWEFSEDGKTWAWTIRLNRPSDKPDEWNVSFIDTATKVDD